MAKVMLIYPPLAQPYSPSLAIAELASVLTKEGHTVSTMDLNIRAHIDLLSPSNLEKAYNKLEKIISYLEKSNSLKSQDILTYSKLIGPVTYGPKIISGIEKSIKALKKLNNYHLDNEGKEFLLKDWAVFETASHMAFRVMDQSYYDNASCFMNEKAIIKAIKEPPITPYFNFFSNYIKEILSFNPDVLGINVTFPEQLIPAFILSNMVRKQIDCPVLIGGSVPTLLRNDLANHPELFEFVDGIGISDGEPAFLELLNGKNLYELPNILVLHSNGRVQQSSEASWNILDSPVPEFNNEDLSLLITPQPIIPYQTVRSCYFGRCKFCNYKVVHPQLKERSISQVCKDLQVLSDKYNTDLISFADDAMAPSRILAVAKEIKRKNLRILWWTCTRFDGNWNSNMVKELEDAGCARLFFGLESADSRIQKKIAGKGFSINKVHQVLNLVKKTKIHIHLSAIIGFPSETLEEAKKTIYFMKRASTIPKITTRVHFFRLVKDSHIALSTDIERANNYGITDIKRSELDTLAVEYAHYCRNEGINKDEAWELIEDFEDYKQKRPMNCYAENHTFEPLIWAKNNSRKLPQMSIQSSSIKKVSPSKLLPTVTIRKIVFSPFEAMKIANQIYKKAEFLVYADGVQKWEKVLKIVQSYFPAISRKEGLFIFEIVTMNSLPILPLELFPLFEMLSNNYSLLSLQNYWTQIGLGNYNDFNEFIKSLNLSEMMK